MATDSDAEKLLKQIDVLSSLIHTHKELNKIEKDANDNQTRFSWGKTSSSSKLVHDVPSLFQSGEPRKPSVTIKDRTPSSAVSLSERKTVNLKRTESQRQKPALKKTQNSMSNKIVKSQVSTPFKKPATQQQAKPVKSSADSTSLLSARLSSLSSCIAEAKSKLILKTNTGQSVGQSVGGRKVTVGSVLPSSSKPSPPSPSISQKATPHSTSFSYTWSKSQISGNTNKSDRKSSKPVVQKVTTSSLLKWTKPGVKEHKYEPSKTSMTSAKYEKRKMLYKSLPSYNSHVWRSQGSFKLDRRQRNSGNNQLATGFIKRREKVVLRDTPRKALITRYSVVNLKRKCPIRGENKMVLIGGIPYKTSANKLQKASQEMNTSSTKKAKRKSSLLLNIKGERFLMDATGKTLTRIQSGKTPVKVEDAQPGTSRPANLSSTNERQLPKRRLSLKRIVIGGQMFIETSPGVMVRSNKSVNKKLASQVLRRSLQNSLLYKYKKSGQVKPKSQQYCMFYNRFGKCNKGDKCPYIHDPTKIAVCTKFLKGKCKKTDGSCSFSHKIDKDKMPVCQYFLRGTCTNDDCPYSHVNVSSKAAVCQDFIKGYCPNGQQCKKKHIVYCEEFSQTGKCSLGKKCNLMHRDRKRKRRRKSSTKESRPNSKRAALEMTEDEGFLPLESMNDSTEKVSTDSIEATQEHQGIELQTACYDKAFPSMRNIVPWGNVRHRLTISTNYVVLFDASIAPTIAIKPRFLLHKDGQG